MSSPAVKTCEVLPVTQSIAPRGLRVGDAARYAGTTHWHIRTAIWTGRLKAYRAGKVIIVLREDLDRYLNSLPEVQPNNAEWLADRQQKAAS
jgi:excisionase family DNA binding protein